ncbi:NERD domain-containing protein [Pseudomonas donghuensis]|uniref:hypothetical protein n=1 Tax=Pseudomonas donghuensis TaxID=1163398 RepID=UPI0039DFA461
MLDVVSKSLLSEGEVVEALKKCSWKLLRRQLEKVSVKNSSSQLLGLVKRCDYFVNKRPKGRERRGRERAEFFKELIDYLRGKVPVSEVEEFETVFSFFEILDQCYAEFLDFEGQLPAVKDFSAAQRTWAFFSWYMYDHKAFMQRVKETISTKPGIFLDTLVIPMNNGVNFDPGAYHAQQVNTLAAALLMEAYRGDWFDANGKVIIPARVSVSEKQASEVGVIFVNANSWATFEELEQHVRYLGRSYELVPSDACSDAPPGFKYFLKFGECVYPQIMDHVALARNFRRDYGNRYQISGEKKFREFFTLFGSIPSVAVAKEQHLSIASLSIMLNYDVSDDVEEYHGLTLSDWIKGYSALKFFVRLRQCPVEKGEMEVAEIIEFQRGEFLDFLESLGFSSEKATAVIDNYSFSKRSRDLFDAPLIATENGYVVMSDVVSGAVVSRAVASNVLSRNTVFKLKGSALEDRLHSVLEEGGVEVRRIKKKYAGQEYEYDALALWGGKLFILECKNRWLSEGRVVPIYNIWDQMRENIDQVKRLQRGVELHPDILTEAFGRKVVYDEIVPCVVAGVPYALERKVNGVFFTDISIVDRFFSENSFTYDELDSRDGVVGCHSSRAIYNQWQAEKPSVADFMKVLEAPLQVHLALKSMSFEKIYLPIGKSMVYEADIPSSLPLTIEQYMQLINEL